MCVALIRWMRARSTDHPLRLSFLLLLFGLVWENLRGVGEELSFWCVDLIETKAAACWTNTMIMSFFFSFLNACLIWFRQRLWPLSEIAVWEHRNRESYVWSRFKKYINKKNVSIFNRKSNGPSRCLDFGKTTARVKCRTYLFEGLDCMAKPSSRSFRSLTINLKYHTQPFYREITWKSSIRCTIAFTGRKDWLLI